MKISVASTKFSNKNMNSPEFPIGIDDFSRNALNNTIFPYKIHKNHEKNSPPWSLTCLCNNEHRLCLSRSHTNKLIVRASLALNETSNVNTEIYEAHNSQLIISITQYSQCFLRFLLAPLLARIERKREAPL